MELGGVPRPAGRTVGAACPSSPAEVRGVRRALSAEFQQRGYRPATTNNKLLRELSGRSCPRRKTLRRQPLRSEIVSGRPPTNNSLDAGFDPPAQALRANSSSERGASFSPPGLTLQQERHPPINYPEKPFRDLRIRLALPRLRTNTRGFGSRRVLAGRSGLDDRRGSSSIGGAKSPEARRPLVRGLVQ